MSEHTQAAILKAQASRRAGGLGARSELEARVRLANMSAADKKFWLRQALRWTDDEIQQALREF
jgi:hypothetical protein